MEVDQECNLTQLMCMSPSFASLPARIDGRVAAKLLGFKFHDISILIDNSLLKPLGQPKSNAPKYFAKTTIFGHSLDSNWLSKATKVLSDNWRKKNSLKNSTN